MTKPAIFGFLIVVCLAFIQCKTKEQTVDFDSLTKNYYNDKNELNPLDATQNGQSQFNDKLQFEMTDSFRQKQKKFFENYQK
jgi:glutathionyl-hydroquinone reductase